MACAGCGQARQQFVVAARAFNPRGMASAVARGIAINVDKARAMYRGQQPVIHATPYRRPTNKPDRTP